MPFRRHVEVANGRRMCLGKRPGRPLRKEGPISTSEVLAMSLRVAPYGRDSHFDGDSVDAFVASSVPYQLALGRL